MSARQKNGQAIVLVTLSLFVMAGMMGLAVDFGWMFFLKKSAQAAADAGALAAVQEAKARLGSAFNFSTLTSCPAPSISTPYCQPAPVSCNDASIVAPN